MLLPLKSVLCVILKTPLTGAIGKVGGETIRLNAVQQKLCCLCRKFSPYLRVIRCGRVNLEKIDFGEM